MATRVEDWPGKPGPKAKPLEERFWSKVCADIEDDENSCLLWTGALDENGYGVVQVGTWREPKTKHAHIVAFELCGGVLTLEKPFVLHTCDNPPCVRPDHLYAGDRSDNIQDAWDRGRRPYPSWLTSRT